jgi:hypothetical protein
LDRNLAATHKIIEGNDLIFDSKSNVVGVEKVWVLLLELLPHETSEARFDVRLDLQRSDDLGLHQMLGQ